MIDNAAVGAVVPRQLLQNYFQNLVNQFFKILPMRENEEESLSVYMESLRAELLGCQDLIAPLNSDATYLTLLSTLQYLIDNPGCPVKVVKREVFKAIRICNKLSSSYTELADEAVLIS